MCAFPLGVFLYDYKDEIEKVYERYRWKLVFGLLFISVISMASVLLPQKNTISAIGKNIMCISVGLLVAIGGRFIKVGEIIKKLTRISTELYLYQSPILMCCRIIFDRNEREIGYDYVFIVVVGTCMVAILVYCIFECVKKFFRKNINLIINRKRF